MTISAPYLAALVDGEGTICIIKTARGKGTSKTHRYSRFSYQLLIAIAMREETLIRALHAQFGGSFRRVESQTPGHSPIFRWTVVSRDALRILNIIVPFAIAKRQQVGVARQFQEAMKPTGRRTATACQFQEYYYRIMRALNQKGKGKR